MNVINDQVQTPIEKNLNQMSYLELLYLEDEILLYYESLAIHYRSKKSFNQPNHFESMKNQPSKKTDTQQVKWITGKIIIFVMFVFLFLFISNVLIYYYGHLEVMKSFLSVFIYLGVALFCILISDLFWQILFTPIIRSAFRGIVHYWPVTLSLVYIYKVLF